MRGKLRAFARIAGIAIPAGRPWCVLDLVNPLLNPSILVVAVLTFIEEVGQPDSWWWIVAIALANLVVVRLVVWLVTSTTLGCLLFLRSWWDTRGRQGEYSLRDDNQ